VGGCAPLRVQVMVAAGKEVDQRLARDRDNAGAPAVGSFLERLARVRLIPQPRHPALFDIIYDDGLFDDADTLSNPNVLNVVVPVVEDPARQDWLTAAERRGVWRAGLHDVQPRIGFPRLPGWTTCVALGPSSPRPPHRLQVALDRLA
jgi:hypothetical protein